MDQFFTLLCRHYFPFNKLSRDRLMEVVNHVRFMELLAGEIFQIGASASHTCLYLLTGGVKVIQEGAITGLSDSNGAITRPLTLKNESSSASVIAEEDSIICTADSRILDDMISWDDTFNAIEDIPADLANRINLIRHSLIFRRLPYHCIESAFRRMTTRRVKKGEDVISFGETGDAYYIIGEGRADVFQIIKSTKKEEKVVELAKGDAFGEEALISGKKRQERVRMTEDGLLLVLDKEAFNQLIKRPLVNSVDAQVAKSMIESGYLLIDVRRVEEFSEEHIPGAHLIPLIELRNRINELDRGRNYIVY